MIGLLKVFKKSGKFEKVFPMQFSENVLYLLKGK